MKERPILFSAPMVRAIDAGTKTQTRRLMTPQPDHLQHHQWGRKLIYEGEHRLWCWKTHTFENLWDEHIRDADREALAALCPHGLPGDRLWVRETFSAASREHHSVADYPADGRPRDSAHYWSWYAATDDAEGPWSPSIFMPRWASRITLEITDVRVHRLQEISGEDARSEGISVPRCACEVCARSTAMCPADASAHIEEFAELWDSINGKPRRMLDDDGEPVLDDNNRSIMLAAKSWASNPWVWAITFRRWRP